jgi:hypothetical protein
MAIGIVRAPGAQRHAAARFGTGVAAKGALGAWVWPPYCPRHRVSPGATPVPVRSASPRAIGVAVACPTPEFAEYSLVTTKHGVIR